MAREARTTPILRQPIPTLGSTARITETKLCFIGTRRVDACLTLADGHAERVPALHMIETLADRPTAIALGAEKAYVEDFVSELRSMNVAAHVAQNANGCSAAVDGRTQLAHPQVHRGGIRLDQDSRRAREDYLPWP